MEAYPPSPPTSNAQIQKEMMKWGQRDTNDGPEQQIEYKTKILNYREKVTLQMIQCKKGALTQKTWKLRNLHRSTEFKKIQRSRNSERKK